jgi:hypothetical protein
MEKDSKSTPAQFLQRIGRSWNNFWFRPSDPSTLGLMRVLVGIVVVYVHLAYTRDLVTFFGKDGWADIQLAEQLRKEYPVLAPTTEWEDPAQNITIPADADIRKLFFDWLRTLPADREQRKEQLAYLYNLPHGDFQMSTDLLALAEHVMIWRNDNWKRDQGQVNPGFEDFRKATESERREILDAIVRPPSNKLDRDRLLPKHVQEMPEPARLQLREQLERFIATLPSDPPAVSRLFTQFAFQAITPLAQRTHSDPRTDLQRMLVYIEKDLPDKKADREDTLAYMERWQLDPHRLYSRGSYYWSIFYHVTDPTAMYAIHAVFLVIMIMFALGLFTRVTSVLTWLAALCYVHRTNQVLFGMDVMMNINLIYLMIAPCGAALSLDRWLAVRRARKVLDGTLRGDAGVARAVLAGPQPSVSANFATRLFQIHFCFIYAASGLAKLKGGAWWSHQAIWLTIANPEFSPTVFGPYRWFLEFLADHRLLCEIMMSAGAVYTLALEIGFPFLVWRPRLRPYLVIAAVLLHVGIATMMGLTVFSLLMMLLLMSFIPPETVRQWLVVGKGRLFSLRAETGSEPSTKPLAKSAIAAK